jgi:hypothetical protein
VPDEVTQRRMQQGRQPYEIWKYTRTRSFRYIFMDLTQFGNYTLIFTNDVREKSRPDWQELLGPEGLKDLEQNKASLSGQALLGRKRCRMRQPGVVAEAIKRGM